MGSFHIGLSGFWQAQVYEQRYAHRQTAVHLGGCFGIVVRHTNELKSAWDSLGDLLAFSARRGSLESAENSKPQVQSGETALAAVAGMYNWFLGWSEH